MINYILAFMAFFSLLASFFTGKTGELSQGIINAGNDGIELTIKLAGVICLWSGLSEIAEKCGITKALCRLLQPFLKLIFPQTEDKEAKEAIAMNFTANFLGLGNASTPFGLKAMKRLSQISPLKERASDDMVRFVVINCAGFRLLSTTVAMLRSEYGSADPMEILLPTIITSFCALSVGIILSFILKRGVKS